MLCLPGVCAAPGSVSGGGSAAHQRVGGPGGVSASGSLQVTAAGAQPPGSPAAGPPQREPGWRALRPEVRVKEDPVLSKEHEKLSRSVKPHLCHKDVIDLNSDELSDPDPGLTVTQTPSTTVKLLVVRSFFLFITEIKITLLVFHKTTLTVKLD